MKETQILLKCADAWRTEAKSSKEGLRLARKRDGETSGFISSINRSLHYAAAFEIQAYLGAGGIR